MTWRSESARVIASVIREIGISDEKRLRKALRDAYPFGEREHYPYQCWREEVKRALTAIGIVSEKQKAMTQKRLQDARDLLNARHREPMR